MSRFANSSLLVISNNVMKIEFEIHSSMTLFTFFPGHYCQKTHRSHRQAPLKISIYLLLYLGIPFSGLILGQIVPRACSIVRPYAVQRQVLKATRVARVGACCDMNLVFASTQLSPAYYRTYHFAYNDGVSLHTAAYHSQGPADMNLYWNKQKLARLTAIPHSSASLNSSTDFTLRLNCLN